ncbi:YlzJ-like family protein [Bacillus sp. FJAT-29790]|uniref:YlzJ-like family protein n=1 Tax=Bacillus sp. FJAT-29790 TaxID=1895002 RepID=UPI001C24A58C|nr:YlzJ-like family protein [Bacillus sp. FJAT-29790]MBU8877892.1 YlzJ-like family protein [Bacillus sp. FJAT-29790]
MILYTMMPQELIYQTDANEFGKQKLVTYDGIPLLVDIEEGQNCTVIRVMSSDPAHFMNEKYTPGTKITLS